MTAPRDQDACAVRPAGWHFLDDLVLRKAGFSFDLLSGLRCPTTYRLLGEASDLDRALARLGVAIREELDSRERAPQATGQGPPPQRGRLVLRALKVRTSLSETPGSAQAPAWNRTVARWRGAMAEASAAFAEESAEARRRLLELGGDRRVQEAVYLNSPSFYSHGLLPLVSGALHGTKRRSAEVTLTAYLQRFCAKNDTTSYFGPINYGRIGRDAGLPALTYRMTVPEAWSRVHASHWFVAELYRKVLADEQLQLALPVERSALIRQSGDQVTVPGLPPMRLDDLCGKVLRASLPGQSGLALAQRLDLDRSRLRPIVSRLNELGILRLRAEPPADRLDVLTAFSEMIAAAPRSSAQQGWLALAAQVTDLLRRFEGSDLPARIELMDELERLCADRLQVSPRRGAGRLYVDRFLLFDQCVGDISELVVAGRLAAAFAGLTTALDLLAWNAREVSLGFKRRAWALVQAAGLAGQTIPLLELLERQPQPESAGAADRSAWRRFWASVLDHRAPGRLLALSRSQIEATSLVDLSIGGLVAAPDVMLAAADADAIERGDFKIVLAEVHPIVVPAQLHFYGYHPEAAAVAQRARRALETTFGGTEEAILASTRVSKITESGLQRVRIHQDWLGCSADAEDVPIVDLDADLAAPDGCSLSIRGTDRRLYLKRPLFADEPMPAVLGLFERPEVWATEIDVADHVPRIEVDGIVIQRERWRFGSADLPDPRTDRDSFEFYASVVAWQKRHEMPQHVFGRLLGRGEVKPFLIDFGSPHSCIAFVRECQGAQGMVATEMYPGPDELWLRGPEGGFTSEFRLNAFSRRPGSAASATPDDFVKRLAQLQRAVAPLHVED